MAKKLSQSQGREARPDAEVIKRLMARIDFDGPPNNNGCTGKCWIFSGYTDRKGYGQIKFGGRAFWAHRLSYLIFNGSLVEGMHVDHKCHCTSCVNPDHLQQIDWIENSTRNRPPVSQEEPPF